MTRLVSLFGGTGNMGTMMKTELEESINRKYRKKDNDHTFR